MGRHTIQKKHQKLLAMRLLNNFLPLAATVGATLLLAFGNPSAAQIVDKTKDKAERKSERRVDQKIDDGIDKGLDAIEGLFKKKKKKKDKEERVEERVEESADTRDDSDAEAAQAQQAALMQMMGGGEADVEDYYDFSHRYLINIQTFNKNDKLKEEQDMVMFIDDDEGNFGMEVDNEGVSQYIIYDLDSGEMLTLMNTDGQKMGMAINLDDEWLEAVRAEDTETQKELSFTKTGQSKSISGYSCDEYVVEGGDMEPDEHVSIWVTDKLDTDWMDTMMKMTRQNKKIKGAGVPGGYPDGTVIQSVSEDTKSGEKVVTTVEKVETGDFGISTEGYRFMNMGNMGGR